MFFSRHCLAFCFVLLATRPCGIDAFRTKRRSSTGKVSLVAASGASLGGKCYKNSDCEQLDNTSSKGEDPRRIHCAVPVGYPVQKMQFGGRRAAMVGRGGGLSFESKRISAPNVVAKESIEKIQKGAHCETTERVDGVEVCVGRCMAACTPSRSGDDCEKLASKYECMAVSVGLAAGFCGSKRWEECASAPCTAGNTCKRLVEGGSAICAPRKFPACSGTKIGNGDYWQQNSHWQWANNFPGDCPDVHGVQLVCYDEEKTNQTVAEYDYMGKGNGRCYIPKDQACRNMPEGVVCYPGLTCGESGKCA